MSRYTAFCQAASGQGTIWIDFMEAESVDAAILAAIEACAHDWDCSEDLVHCLGIAEGDVNILVWNDLNED